MFNCIPLARLYPIPAVINFLSYSLGSSLKAEGMYINPPRTAKPRFVKTYSPPAFMFITDLINSLMSLFLSSRAIPSNPEENSIEEKSISFTSPDNVKFFSPKEAPAEYSAGAFTSYSILLSEYSESQIIPVPKTLLPETLYVSLIVNVLGRRIVKPTFTNSLTFAIKPSFKSQPAISHAILSVVVND